MRRRTLALLTAASLCLGMGIASWMSHAHAQIPDEFKNLEVLPKDVSKSDLMDAMKGFTSSLGVRCEHCHVGEAGKPLSEFDFASDEKEPKKTARVMMRLRQEINDKLRSSLGDGAAGVEVECVTCHRGQPVPRMLEDVLFEEFEENGAEATVAKYREYRDQYYGGFSYDFGEGTLLQLAGSLAATDPQAALSILELNLEFFPESVGSLVQKGNVLLAQGDKEAAVRALEKAYEIQPHPRLKQMLDRAKESE